MDYRYGSHTVFNIEYHFVWVTKYRYKVLTGDVALRVRELVRQTCELFEIKILKGVVSKDHVPILVSAPPHMAPSEIMRRIKGRSSSKLFEEFPLLKKRYWGRHGWAEDRRDDPRVSGPSLRAESLGQLSYGGLVTGLGPVSGLSVYRTNPPA